jgi:ankyrin repeat protein
MAVRPRTLKSAAEAGDLDAVRYHLAKGADINGTTAAGHFALGGAILHGHDVVVEYLIAQGADINQESEFGWTPLYLAAWSDKPKCAALLLLNRVRLNTKTRGGWNSPSGYTPLHIAAERGHLAVVMLLIAAGANVDEETGSSQTALDLATDSGRASVMKFLKKAGPIQLGRPGSLVHAIGIAMTDKFMSVEEIMKRTKTTSARVRSSLWHLMNKKLVVGDIKTGYKLNPETVLYAAIRKAIS